MYGEREKDVICNSARACIRLGVNYQGRLKPTCQVLDLMSLQAATQIGTLSVQPAERKPKRPAGCETCDPDTSIHSYQVRIRAHADESKLDGGCDGVWEQERAHHDRLHPFGRLGERVLETGDGSEDLGEAEDDV
jgi:hypothetical protein